MTRASAIKWLVRSGAGVALGVLFADGWDFVAAKVALWVLLFVGVFEGVMRSPWGDDDGPGGPFRPT